MMIRLVILMMLVFSETFYCAAHISGNDKNWDLLVVNTAVNVDYLNQIEKDVILEINKLRSNPQAYAQEYLVPLLSRYDGKKLYMQGDDVPYLTREGISALREAIQELRNAIPVPLVNPDVRLTKAARDHQKDQTYSGRTGHIGGDGSNYVKRIERYAKWDVMIAENIFYGDPDARGVIINLLIDDGVPNRGHRHNLLNKNFRYVGVATGLHKVYRNMCVMDFSGGFR